MRLPLFAAAIACALTSQADNSPYLSRVLEFQPAPGQFVNTIPEYEPGDDMEAMTAKAAEQICGARQPGMISLGAFGGYVVVAFDHTVVNQHGRYDFQIYGNALQAAGGATGGSAEPGIVMVMADENGNGLPDDVWYELAGCEYRNPGTRHNVEITYHRPDTSREPEIDPDGEKNYDPDPDYRYITDRSYIRFTTDDPSKAEGFISRISFHSQPYWPQWTDATTLSFRGSRLPDNFEELSGTGTNYVQRPYAWGYVDNLPNNSYKGFSIDWAVDADGNPVRLAGIDFIKVYTAVSQQCGWLGESSTEICGGEDLHPDAVYSSAWPDDPIDPDTDYPGGTSASVRTVATPAAFSVLMISEQAITLRLAADATAVITDMAGRTLLTRTLPAGDSTADISGLAPGAYILRAGTDSFKFLKK